MSQVFTSSDANPAVLGTGLFIGIQGSPQSADPSPISFIGVQGFGSNVQFVNGIPLGATFGVVGTASGGAGTGVKGENPNNIGVFGVGDRAVVGQGTSTGVTGESTNGTGVSGESTDGVGVLGKSENLAGVSGSTNSSSQAAVFGINNAKGQVPDGLNRPAGSGVWGHTTVEKGGGVTGSVDGNLSQAAGVVGIGPTAGRFFGNVEVTASLTVDQDLQVKGDVFLVGRDLAEQFAVEAPAECRPGALMVIRENGALAPCSVDYDKRAIGVVSGGER